MFQRISKRFLTSSVNKGIGNNGSNFSFKRSLGYSLAIGGVACLAVASISQTNPNGNLTSLEAQGPKSSSKALPAAGVKGGVERTFIAIKPDGTQRGLVGKIVDRFESKGYKLVAIKSMVPSRELAEVHYGDLKGRPFYEGLVSYMTSGKAPVVAMVWEGIDVIRQGRRIIGATNPLDADPGSIRGQYCISVGRNIIHGSDSFDSASVEIPLWFKPEELTNWEFANAEWITSKN